MVIPKKNKKIALPSFKDLLSDPRSILVAFAAKDSMPRTGKYSWFITSASTSFASWVSAFFSINYDFRTDQIYVNNYQKNVIYFGKKNLVTSQSALKVDAAVYQFFNHFMKFAIFLFTATC